MSQKKWMNLGGQNRVNMEDIHKVDSRHQIITYNDLQDNPMHKLIAGFSPVRCKRITGFKKFDRTVINTDARNMYACMYKLQQQNKPVENTQSNISTGVNDANDNQYFQRFYPGPSYIIYTSEYKLNKTLEFFILRLI